jgi:hypothetical protein
MIYEEHYRKHVWMGSGKPTISCPGNLSPDKESNSRPPLYEAELLTIGSISES